MRRLVAAAMIALVSGCTPYPTPIPRPTLTPTAAVTPAPESPRFQIDNDLSTFRYTAAGQGLLGFAQLPGLFKLRGRTVTLIPEAEGFRVKLDMVIDGNSATAVNALFLSTLRSVLEIDTYPLAFVAADSTEIIHLTDEVIGFVLSGTLELRGRKRPLDLPISMTIREGVLRGKGVITLDLTEYDVNVPTAIMSSRITFEAEIVALAVP